jgi:hypothetical protein
MTQGFEAPPALGVLVLGQNGNRKGESLLSVLPNLLRTELPQNDSPSPTP